MLGVDDVRLYPVAVDCPLCGNPGKLELRSPTNVTCRACHFTGDVVELLARKREEPLEQTVDDLESRSLLDFTTTSRERYLSESEFQQRLKSGFIELCGESQRAKPPASVAGILDRLNCGGSTRVFGRLMPHAFPLHRQTLDEILGDYKLPKTAKPALTWWRKYMSIAIPAWEGADIIGLFLLTTNGSHYLPLFERMNTGAAFAKVPSFIDPAVVVMDNIEQALRLTIWSMIEGHEATGFTVPYGVRDAVEYFRSGRTVFWSPSGDVKHALRAMGTPDARVLTEVETGAFHTEREYPCGNSFGRFQRALEEALPAHQAVAYQLAQMKVPAARAVLAGHTIDIVDRAKIMAYLQGEDAKHVGRLFEDVIRDETVTWNGYVVTDTPEGWISKGKLVTSAKLVVEKIRPLGRKGEALTEGHILYQTPSGDRVTIRFREKLSVLRRNTADWLQRKVVADTGYVPYIDAGWSKRLFEIAQQFHLPTPVLQEQSYGWTENGLAFPNFTVTPRGLRGNRSMIDGPALPLPSPLSPAEWDAFKVHGFCRLALALTGNILRTKYDRPGMGLMLTNEPHVIQRLSSALGCGVAASPDREKIEEAALKPLPLFTEWTTPRLRDMFLATQGHRNIVLSVDGHTARLSTLNAEWLQLRVGPGVDYQALRGIFYLLPKLLTRNLDLDADTFYRDLATAMDEQVAEHCVSKLGMAAVDLDQYYSYRSGTAASRIMELIFWGIDRGDIEPEYFPTGVFVAEEQFVAATANPVVQIPPFTDLTSKLREASFLQDREITHNTRRVGGWFIPKMVWDLNASLMQVAK